jgi:hypothetical protein
MESSLVVDVDVAPNRNKANIGKIVARFGFCHFSSCLQISNA